MDIQQPVYLQIALDIAGRISGGELNEGKRIYGRSILAGEYGVSPETIRRALKLLEDMGVVEIRDKSGVTVISRRNAKEYIEHFSEKTGFFALRKKLDNLLGQQEALSRQIQEVVIQFSASAEWMTRPSPFQSRDTDIPADSPILGKTPDELHFWQQTGATIIAIRRDNGIILSPGPYIRFQEGDTLVHIGSPAAAENVRLMVEGSLPLGEQN